MSMQVGFDFDARELDVTQITKHLLALGKIRHSDVKLAKMVAFDNDAVYFLVLLLLIAEQQQHTCLELRHLDWMNPFGLRDKEQVIDFPLDVISIKDAVEAIDLLEKHPAVGDNKPLSLFGSKLYLSRHARYEATLSQRFLEMANRQINVDAEQLKWLLAEYFPKQSDEVDWQKVACANAVLNGFSIITGGPGTGKTTTVTKLLAILQSLYQGAPLNIKLVAPTGKAAARLSESIKSAKHKLALPEMLSTLIPEDGQTLHRLLGVIPFSNKFRHNESNPLHLDVLIVDEASMVDLSLMAKLVKALPKGARLILLGDKDQLASVDTGCVLGDLCQKLTLGVTPSYTPEHRLQLENLCEAVFSAAVSEQDDFKLRDSLSFLQKSHRFNEQSGIGQLALAVNNNDSRHLDWVLAQGFADIQLENLSQQSYTNLILGSAQRYAQYLTAIARNEKPSMVHELFNQYRLLCAVREGAYGANELNFKIEQALVQQGLILRTGRFYLGMPIMITHNDYQLKLFNGDIGILMLDDDGELKASFIDDAGETRFFYPARLPQFELAYVMTIHKSQGSEFPHTAILLPPMQKAQQGINRQLVYTGITRAKLKLELVAQPEVLKLAMRKSVQRSSGLYERLIS
nr:exodeoxyribonuclease V subunit alpha [Pseudoalteromonas xiamenensis]